MTPLILAPILTQLASKGLDLIGSAVLAKGKDVVEQTLGVDIEESLKTEAGTEALQMAQMTHEERLLELALEDKQLKLDYYKQDILDSANAREREIRVMEADHAGWLNANLVPMLALMVIIGGGFMLVYTKETDLRMAVVGMMTMVLGYYFGKSSSEWKKDSTINKLSQKE